VLAFAITFGAVMMYRRHYGEVVECGECGAFIPSSSTTCPKCGIEFETDLARCSECEAWIPANSSSCPVCGTAFTIESLEEQVAREEAEEEVPTIDEVTTSTAKVAPLALDAASEAKWGDREAKRRRRIKKRVKKRLTVTDTTEAVEDEEGAKDLFVGEEADTTRLPGLDVDESAVADEDLSRLLPTEDMLKDLMLTTEDGPADLETEPMEPEGELDLGEGDELPEDEEPAPELDELPLEEVSLEEAVPEDEGQPEPPEEDLEEIPVPEEMAQDEGTEDLAPEPEPDEEEGEGGKELLSELGLMADEAPEPEDEGESEEEGGLPEILGDEEESKEAPKLCPNCGGNWILYKDGEYTCRICGENW
jgi:predicted amidophosphoribosyltransferase